MTAPSRALLRRPMLHRVATTTRFTTIVLQSHHRLFHTWLGENFPSAIAAKEGLTGVFLANRVIVIIERLIVFARISPYHQMLYTVFLKWLFLEVSTAYDLPLHAKVNLLSLVDVTVEGSV